MSSKHKIGRKQSDFCSSVTLPEEEQITNEMKVLFFNINPFMPGVP